jgi:hypothetical protein
MGESRGGDGHPADTGHTERVQPSQWAGPAANLSAKPEKAASAGREGKLDLNVPQVAGSAVAAIVAAKLASNLGVYGTIVGAGVVSVLGTCGGSILQHIFRRTGRQVQEVAVQARPGVRRVRERAWVRTDAVREADRARVLPQTDPAGGHLALPQPDPTGAWAMTGTYAPAGTGPLAGADAVTGAGADEFPGIAPAPGTAPATGTDAGGDAGRDGYGEATSYRAGRRGWKRPVIAVALAFGLTMAGITGYEAIAGENISGNGHGTTIGNAVTGHDSPHSGGTEHTPAPGGTDTPSSATTTSPQGRDGGGRTGQDTAPSTPQPTTTPSHGTGTGTGTGGAGGSTSGGGHSTPTPTSAAPTPTPTATPSDGDGNGAGTGTGTAP